jgi:hypothetical protein
MGGDDVKKNDMDEVERICAYCVHAGDPADTDVCVCDLRGVVKPEGNCKKFKADLLKYNPGRKKLPDFKHFQTF